MYVYVVRNLAVTVDELSTMTAGVHSLGHNGCCLVRTLKSSC